MVALEPSEGAMIDRRFSIQQFEARGHNTDASNELARDLQIAIAHEVLADLRAIGAKIAAQLKELGHAVDETEHDVDPEGMASVTFADTSNGSLQSEQRLRFNFDLVVSAGFPGYSEDDEPDDEVSGLITG
jgi:hypothetical protein